MLLIDKYRVNSTHDLAFNQDIYERLLDVSPTKSNVKSFKQRCSNELSEIEKLKRAKFSKMGNLLVHGYNKTTLVNLLLKEFYGPDVLNTELVPYHIEKYGAKGKLITVEQSQYHIVIIPNGSGLDKYVIQEVVKEYASTEIFQTNQTRVPFKIVLIKNAHNLAMYAQTSLRRTMEIYYKTCRFILCTDQSSMIIEPIRSRCCLIRLPKPTNNDLMTLVTLIAHRENINIDYPTAKFIVSKSNRNVNICLWWLQHYRFGIVDFSVSWKVYLNQIISILDYVYKNKKVVKQTAIIQLRKVVNDLLLTNISCSEIMNEFLAQMLGHTEYGHNQNVNICILAHRKYSYKLLSTIIEIFYKYDQRIASGTRHIIHIETMFINLMKVLYDNSYKK